MRLDRLDLTRYGAFTDRRIDFGSAPTGGTPDLHVVFGPNEAGKSTLFSAWLDLLFGVQSGHSYDFLHRGDSQAVGAALSLGNGSHELVRTGTAKGGMLTASGASIRPDDLVSGALGGLGRDDYATMFSLDAEELEQGGRAILASDGRLGELLFSAGTGLAGVSEELQRLASLTGKFYKPGGSTQELSRLKSEIKEIDERIREADTKAGEHRAMIEARDEAQARRAEALAAYGEALGRHKRLTAMLDALVENDERLKAESRLAALLDTPPHGDAEDARALRALPPIEAGEWRDRVAALASDRTALDQAGRHLEARATKLAAERASLVPDPAALECADAFQALHSATPGADEGRGRADLASRMVTAEADLPRREGELAEIDEGLRTRIDALGVAKDVPASGDGDLGEGADGEGGGAANDGAGAPSWSAPRLAVPGHLAGALRDLIERRTEIVAGLRAATDEHDQAERALAALLERAGGLPDDATASEGTLDGEAIATIERLLRETHISGAVSEARGALARAREAMAAKARALGIEPGEDPGVVDWPSLLARLAPPPAELAQRWIERADEIDERERRRVEARGELARARARLTGREGGLVLPTPEETCEARKRRDEAWRALGDMLDAGDEPVEARRAARRFEELAAAHDRLTETRIAGAERLAEERENARRLAEIDAEDAVLAARADEIARDRETLRGEICAAAKPLVAAGWSAGRGSDEGAVPEPRMLARFVQGHGALLREADELRGIEQRLDRAVEDETRIADRLSACLYGLGREHDPGEGLVALGERADAWLETARAQRDEARALGQALDGAKAEIHARAERLEAMRRREEAWRTEWLDVLEGSWLADHPALRLGSEGDDAGLERPRSSAVTGLLEEIGRFAASVEARGKVARQVRTMREDQTRFLHALGTLATLLGIVTSEEAASGEWHPRWREVLASARARIEEARENEKRADALAAEEHALEKETERHCAAREAHGAELGELSAMLRTDDPAAMRLAVDWLAERDALVGKRDGALERMARFLHVPASDVAAEIEEADRDALAVEAEEIASRLPTLERDRDEALGDLARASKVLEDVGGDARAAKLATERRTLLLRMEEGARRALSLELGAEAARRALHAYREQHRGAMMDRASDAFRTVSCGAFAGLASRHAEGGERLVARRPDGTELSVHPGGARKGARSGAKGTRTDAAGLSKGTRHQLYLALRIAGYHEYAEHRTPPPFVCDDVMETFDDERSHATLRLFGEMAKRGQVIVLTHHRHLLDIARDAVPGVRCHEIEGPATVAGDETRLALSVAAE